MNRCQMRVRFTDPASKSSAVVKIDTQTGEMIILGDLWPADLETIRMIQEILEQKRHRYSKHARVIRSELLNPPKAEEQVSEEEEFSKGIS